MMPLPRTLLAILAALAGCATRTATHPLPAAELSRLRSEVAGQKAKVVVRSTGGSLQTFRGRARIEADQLWLDPGDPKGVPLSQVAEIDVNHAGSGAARGALIGLGTGVAAGVLLGLATGQDCSKHQGWAPCFTRSDNILLFSIPMALVGLVVGAPIGAAAGAGPVWRFK
jgi:hypothetical protein